MNASDYQIIRQLFDDYLRMYSTRDDRLTTYFSEDFSGFTGGGDFLVKNREEWVAITRQDFAQIKNPIRIELKDLAIQSLADTIAVATGFFTIHLPIEDHILSRETARLVLIFRSEAEGWKISHSSISIPYYLVREGEIYPMKELVDRNQFLEKLVTERTNQLSEANDNLRQANEKLAREIAERMKSEEALKNSLSLLEASLESTADGILIVDTHGKISRWNRKFAKMWMIPEDIILSYDDEKAINHILRQLVDPDQFVSRVRELYGNPEQSSFDLIEFLDGRVFERYSQPQRIVESIVGRLWSFRDITERKQAEEEKERLQDQLIQAQKMESVGQLAGGVAHEFNNMLGVILGHAEMAMDQIDPSEPLYGDLEQIRRAAGRSADITRQLLAFARKQNIAPKVLDLNETIEIQLKMLRRLIGENIDLLWKPVSDLWTIKADPSQIDQILTNLCVNARDAITGIGRITVKTRNCFLDDNYCETHPGCVSGEYVLISVSDTGCGIDERTLDHIFEPFFTTKNVGQGTGLGLAMVYGAVKQNNGFVDVVSEPEQGTVFTIYLPRYMEKGTTGQETGEGVGGPAEGGRETILLVEDERSILQMATRMLQSLGYSVLTASTPGEAIRLAEVPDGEIHLLITDVIMPEMNGLALAERLLTVNNRIKCLFMSGYTSDIIDNQGLLVEGMHFIQKPFSKKELAAKIREVLNEGKSI